MLRHAAHRLDHARSERDVRNEPAVHDVEMDPVGARRIDRANFFAEPREVGGEERWRDKQRRAHARGILGRTKRAMASATPASSLVVAVAFAAARTQAGACPIATDSPARANIGRSFAMSPSAATCVSSTPNACASAAIPSPLLARRCVISR